MFKLKSEVLVGVALTLGMLTTPSASQASETNWRMNRPTDWPNPGREWPELSHLRSAFLQRNTVPHCTNNPTAQLKRHFTVVLTVLARLREVSLEIATDRLEQHLDESWDTEVRAKWLDVLRRSRAVNIQRLRHYRAFGRFPVNHQRTGIL